MRQNCRLWLLLVSMSAGVAHAQGSNPEREASVQSAETTGPHASTGRSEAEPNAEARGGQRESRERRMARLRRSGERSVRGMLAQAERAYGQAERLRRNGETDAADRAERLGDAALMVAEHRDALFEQRGVLRQHERLLEAAEHRREVAAAALSQAEQQAGSAEGEASESNASGAPEGAR